MRTLPIALALLVTSPAWPGATPARADDPAAIPDSVWTSLPWTVLPRIEVRGRAPVDALGPLPLASTRLEGADLDRYRDDDLATLLAPVTGLRLASAGGPAAPARPSLRGSTFEQVLVLVDGRRRNVAQGGGVDLSDIPLASVESVEIARGGASALFGGDAIGGAIQVRTRAPRRTSWRVHAEAGSFEERTLLLTGTTELSSRWSGRASYRDFGTRGDYPYRDDARGTERRVQNGDATERHAELRADADLDAWSLRLDASGLDAERGVPGSEEFPTPSARTADRQWTAGARLAQNVARPWRATFDASWLGRSHAYREPAAAFGPIDESHRNQRVEFESALERIATTSKIRLAGGGSVDWLDSTTDGERARATAHVRARTTRDVSWRGTWRATLAARVDAVEGFAPFAAPRVGLEYAPGERWRWRASAGTSWRAPTFDDLFWPARATAAGNPDLRAERGRDADLGVTLQGLPRETTVTVDAFLRDVTDLIQWSPGASGVWRPHNIGGALVGGVEAECRSRFELGGRRSLSLALSGAWLSTRDTTGEPNVDGRELPYRPRRTGAIDVRLDLSAFALESTWRAIDDVYVTRANTKALPGYVLGDVRLRTVAVHDVAADLGVRNVTNESARDFRDYPLPGRTLFLGLSWARGDA